MLCSSSQFCSHYARATIPIMPALCSNLKDSTQSCIQKPPSTLGIIMVQVKIKFPLHFRSTL